MNFDEPINPDKTIEIVAPARRGKKKVGDIQIHSNHKVWEWNFKTDILKEAEVTETLVVGLDKNKTVTQKAMKGDPNCIVFSALNRKNAEKKVVKLKKANTNGY